MNIVHPRPELRSRNSKKKNKELIKKGYTRIQEKLKEIRQNFSHAVTTGSRSGSGKIVLEFFDQLKQIWGGSPSTQPISSGISTNDVNYEIDDGQSEADFEDSIGDMEDHSQLSTSSADGGEGDSSKMETSIASNGTNRSGGRHTCRKRVASNPVPKLIDNKRKHMEHQLSASQRDQLLMNESKEDADFKKNIAEGIRQSNQTFAQSAANEHANGPGNSRAESIIQCCCKDHVKQS